MAKIEQYRHYIQEIIQRHGAYPPSFGDVELQMIFDTQHDHYQLVHAGWHKKYRQYGCLIHMDIKDGKIWIQHDGTEAGVANELVELGVPKEDIVLAYHPPYQRVYTGFAVN
jgi:hypothetical protein